MKPVDQRIIDPGHGDCMRACLASLLELPYEEVPHLREIQNKGEQSWFEVMFGFLRKHGYDFAGTFSKSFKNSSGEWEGRPIEAYDWEDLRSRSSGVMGFYMAGGPSPRLNCSHAIIIDARGNLIHDPHPSRAGVLKIDHVDMIERLDK
jgi:hypothetical protein